MPRSAADSTPAHRRSFGAGSLTVTLVCDDPTAGNELAHLLAGFGPPMPAATAQLEITLSLTGTTGHAGPLYDSDLAAGPLLHSAALADQAIRITRAINDHKLDAEPHLLHLHAAATARGDRAALLCARSGSGKSSLTAALVRAGWEYVTDEQTAIDPADHALLPYPRPITLRADVWEHFPALGRPPDGVGGDPNSRRMEVSPLDLGVVTGSARLQIAVVVFPLHVAGGPTELVPIGSAGEVVERLASCCYDLERLGNAGFECLVRLAALGTAGELRYDSLDAAVDLLDRAAATGGDETRTVVEHVEAIEPAEVPSGMLRRASPAAGWGFADGSAVIFHPTELRMSRLDIAGLRLWAALDTPRTEHEVLDLAGAEAREQAQALRALLDGLARARLLERA